jgi:aminopeptidase N
MLLEVHRTGALFFDANWVREVLSGHSSAEVAAAVASYIDRLPPDYPPRLREKVLQSSDLLMRAAQSRGH